MMSEDCWVLFIKIKDERGIRELLWYCVQQISDTNLVAVKSEPGVTESHESDAKKSEEVELSLNCDVETERETKVDMRMFFPNQHHVLGSRQHEDELTSELSIKSEHECSAVEQTQDNRGSEDASYIQGNIYLLII
jgi:hypothetical protein